MAGSYFSWSISSTSRIPKETVTGKLWIAKLPRQFNARDLTKLVFVFTALYLAFSVSTEVVLGRFHPQSDNYRFAGGLTPDAQGFHCSLLILSALALLRHTRRRLPLLLGFVGLGVLFLLLTKSVVGCFAFLAAVLVELFLQPRPDREWRNWSWAPGLALALLVVYAMGGRVGTDTPERVAQFAIPALEMLRNVGILSAAAYLFVAVVGLFKAWRGFQTTGEEGYRFLVAQIVLGLVYSLTNAQYAFPTICVAACATSLACARPEQRFAVDAHVVV